MKMPRFFNNRVGGLKRVASRAIGRAQYFSLACAVAVIAGPAPAGAYTLRTVGSWTVGPSKDGQGCFLSRDYDRQGGTTLLLGLDTDGTNRLVVMNANWSIKAKDALKLNFRLSNSSYPAHAAVGIVSQGKQGFVTSFGAKFPSLFASSATLDIKRGEVPVERLSLEGSQAAVAELKKCVADEGTEPTSPAGAKAKSDDIPRDPFAPASKRE